MREGGKGRERGERGGERKRPCPTSRVQSSAVLARPSGSPGRTRPAHKPNRTNTGPKRAASGPRKAGHPRRGRAPRGARRPARPQGTPPARPAGPQCAGGSPPEAVQLRLARATSRAPGPRPRRRPGRERERERESSRVRRPDAPPGRNWSGLDRQGYSSCRPAESWAAGPGSGGPGWGGAGSSSGHCLWRSVRGT